MAELPKRKVSVCLFSCRSQIFPVKCLGEIAVGDQLILRRKVQLHRQLVRLGAVAGKVRKLEIRNVRRMTAFCDRKYVVDAWGHRMWEFQLEIHQLTADTADRLRGVDFFLVRFKLRSLRSVVIGAQIWFCHALTSGRV